jgi:hypothetical protein
MHMFDSKSPVVKVISYAITGFFVLIIIISFGMPDFLSRMGLDQAVIAIVNGEKLNRFDFLRYRNSRFGDLNDRKMDNIILSYYIGDYLLFQEAKKIGFYVTTQGLKDYIINIPGIKDPVSGKINLERLNYFFERITSENEIRKEMIRTKLFQFMKMGISVPSDEIQAEHMAETSRIQFKYSYLNAIDLRNLYNNKIIVSDEEITAEMGKNKSEIKDPKTDRERIRSKLINLKLAKIRKDITDRINSLAMNNGSFDQAQAILGGRVSVSKIFKIGEKMTDQAGQPVAGLNNSSIFLEDFIGTREGQTSRVIDSESGLYIFTPILKEIKKGQPSEKQYQAIAKNLEDQSMMMAIGSLRQKLFENSKKIINLKTELSE